MIGREPKVSNDIFFVCSLIEYIARQTKNHRSVVVNAIGIEKLQHIFTLADIFHTENIDKVSNELIENYNIQTGYFDNVATANYTAPTIWDIGKVYKRLIIDVVNNRNSKEPIRVLFEVYNSWIARKIEDFNSSLYYENPEYIFQSYLSGDMLA